MCSPTVILLYHIAGRAGDHSRHEERRADPRCSSEQVVQVVRLARRSPHAGHGPKRGPIMKKPIERAMIQTTDGAVRHRRLWVHASIAVLKGGSSRTQNRAGRWRDAERWWSESVERGATGKVLPVTLVGTSSLPCPEPPKRKARSPNFILLCLRPISEQRSSLVARHGLPRRQADADARRGRRRRRHGLLQPGLRLVGLAVHLQLHVGHQCRQAPPATSAAASVSKDTHQHRRKRSSRKAVRSSHCDD